MNSGEKPLHREVIGLSTFPLHSRGPMSPVQPCVPWRLTLCSSPGVVLTEGSCPTPRNIPLGRGRGAAHTQRCIAAKVQRLCPRPH